MIYQDIHPAAFLSRPNRFIAQVELDGAVETVHVKNTGRCRELLVPGCTVYLERCPNPARKTKFDLIAVEKARPGLPPLLVNLDAQAPNRVFGEWLASGRGAELGLPKPDLLRPETTWGNSRFDFYWELSEAAAPGPPREPERTLPRRGFVEVKGCTLEENGLALFPDAPTERSPRYCPNASQASSPQEPAYRCPPRAPARKASASRSSRIRFGSQPPSRIVRSTIRPRIFHHLATAYAAWTSFRSGAAQSETKAAASYVDRWKEQGIVPAYKYSANFTISQEKIENAQLFCQL